MSEKCRSQLLKADIRTGIIKIYHASETHNCLSGVDAIVTISGNGERSGPDGYRYITEEQARYANLFAAAPELYEALEKALLLIDMSTSYRSVDIAQQASAALAKARGEYE